MIFKLIWPFLVCLVIGLFGILFPLKADADFQSKSLDHVSATDLSLSLFRDNYDVWAGEVMESLLVDTARQISPLQDKINETKEKTKVLDSVIRARLEELYKARVVDETSVQAALILAKASSRSARQEYLKNAVRMAQYLSPGSLETLKVSLIYLAELLRNGLVSEAQSFGEKVFQFSVQAAADSGMDKCLSLVLVGDSLFQSQNFARADVIYGQANDCVLERPLIKTSHFASQILIRRTWTAFRLMKYPETLDRLTKLLSIADWQRSELSSALKIDLAVMMGVALSESGSQSIPSVLVNAIGRETWIADGLIRSIKYLLQKEQFSKAVRWSESLEAVLSQSNFALEFFLQTVAAYEGEGALEAMNEFKSRAVVVLHPRGALARALSLNPAEDLRRRRYATDWARDVISYRAQQDFATLGVSRLNNLFIVAESLFEDRVEACTNSDSFILVHRVFANARQDALAEKIFAWFKDCTNVQARLAEIELVRIEMFRAAALLSVKDDASWSNLVDQLMLSLSRYRTDAAIRRIALDILNDGMQLAKHKDAERIFLLHLLTAEYSGENAHFERDGLVSAAVRLLVLPDVSPQLEAAGWSLASSLSERLSMQDLNLRKLENALAFHASKVSRSLRLEGRLKQAVLALSEAGEKFKPGSETGANIRFRSVELACRLALEEECITLSGKFIRSAAYPSHDLAVVHHLRGASLLRTGRFLSAAEVFLAGANHAVDSMRSDLLLLLKNDVIRAGEIFADLKLWQETLDARSALVKIADLSGNKVLVHHSVLRWVLQAAAAGAFDKSADLAQDLGKWFEPKINQRRTAGSIRRNNAAMIMYSLAERVPAALSFGQSSSVYQKLLFEALKEIREFRGTVFPDDLRLNMLSIKLVSLARQKWHSEIIKNTETLSTQSSFASLESSLPAVNAAFDELSLGCRYQQSAFVFADLGSPDCAQEISRSFRGVMERMRANAIRANNVERVRMRKYDSAWNTLQSKILSQRSSKMASVRDGSMRFDVFAERRTNLLGQFEKTSVNQGNVR